MEPKAETATEQEVKAEATCRSRGRHGHNLRSLAELQADFEWRRKQRFRSLEALTRDFEKQLCQRRRLQKHAKVAQDAESRKHRSDRFRELVVEMDEAKLESDPRVYEKFQLLGIYAALASAPKASKKAALGLRTHGAPPGLEEVTPTTACGDCEEDPRLDDENIIAEIETRLSRESGADVNNAETFGKCTAGWTFEEAVQANKTHPEFTASVGATERKRRPHPAASATTSCGENDESEGSGDCEDAWEVQTNTVAGVVDSVLLESESLHDKQQEEAAALETFGWDFSAADMGYAPDGSLDHVDPNCMDLSYSGAWYAGCEEWSACQEYTGQACQDYAGQECQEYAGHASHEYAGQCCDYEYLGSEQMWGDPAFFHEGSDMYKISDWSEHYDVNIAGADGKEYLKALATIQE